MGALVCSIDDYELSGFTELAARFGAKRYGYVVTPNVDHVIRLHRDPGFRAMYSDAAYVLLDSRFLAHLLRFTIGLRLPVCTGSDLIARLFDSVVGAGDPLVLIGGHADQAALLRERFGLTDLAHFNPPMGFIHDPLAVEECLRFIESNSPFRFCLLAIGAPQQEAIAQLLHQRGIARGMALCIGGAVNFVTGEERRAPRWVQRIGMEWLTRLLQSPRRFARRYLVTGPRILSLLGRTQFVLRQRSNAQSVHEMSLP